MELKDLLEKLKDDISAFIEKHDDFLFDINPCDVCHDDLNICPNPRCSIDKNGCPICQGSYSICKNCDENVYTKYEEYFILVNGIAANPKKFSQEEIVVMLETAISKINKK